MSDAAAPFRPRGWTARLASGAVNALDRVGGRGRMPASAWLSRHSLWNLIARAPAPAPPGPPVLALSFDLDYAADTAAIPGLLALLDRVGVRSTFFSIGRLVQDDPGPYRDAVAAGQEIGNHTWSHPDNPVLDPDREFHRLSTEDMHEQVSRAQDAFEAALGVRPTGFRSPHFKERHDLLAVLAAHPEMRYLSSVLTSRGPAAAPYFPANEAVAGDQSLAFAGADAGQRSRLLMLPMNPCPAHRWTHFCSYHTVRRPTVAARAQGQHSQGEVLPLWHRMLEGCRDHAFASVYFDPMDVVGDEENEALFEEMLRAALSAGWHILPLDEIAERWRAHLRSGAPPDHGAA